MNKFPYEETFKEYLNVLKNNRYVSDIEFTKLDENITGIQYPAIKFKYMPFRTSEAEAFIYICENLFNCYVHNSIFLFENSMFEKKMVRPIQTDIKIFKSIFDNHYDYFFKYVVEETKGDFELIKMVMKRNLHKEDYDVNLIRSKIGINRFNL